MFRPSETRFEFLSCRRVVPLCRMYRAIRRHEPQLEWSSALDVWDRVVGELSEFVKERGDAYWERPLVKKFSHRRHHDEKHQNSPVW
jgi:hypothetical protein